MAGLVAPAGAAHAALLGIGAYRPSRIVPNSEIVDAIDSSDEWIQTRSGIKQRRWATPEETVQVMSVAAARDALADAGVDARQIDCVIVATVSHLAQTPAIATTIAHELGTEQAAAFWSSASSGSPTSPTAPTAERRSSSPTAPARWWSAPATGPASARSCGGPMASGRT